MNTDRSGKEVSTQVRVTKPIGQKKKSTQSTKATQRENKKKAQDESKTEPLANAMQPRGYNPAPNTQSVMVPEPVAMAAEATRKQPSSHHGSNYQVKITVWIMLFAKRNLSNGKYSKCSITAEDPNGGKFDDTVLHYKQPDGHEKAIYIQCKHKDFTDNQKLHTTFFLKKNNFVGENAIAFSVAKYYKSFCELDPERRIAGTKFVVCTNAFVSNDVELLQKLKPTDKIFENFRRINASFYRINKEKLFNDDQFKCDLNDLDVDCEETKFGFFCDQFFLISNAADVEIDKDSKELWRSITVAKTSVLSLQMGFIEQTAALNSLFVEAWNMTKSSQTITNFDLEDLFKKIVRNLCYQQLKGANSIYCNNWIKLRNDSLMKSKLYKTCEKGGTYEHHTIFSAEICCSIIYQIARLLLSECIFTDYKKYLESADSMEDIFGFLECNLVLVIVCEKDTSLTIFKELFEKNSTAFRKSVILIVVDNKQTECVEFSVSDLTNDLKKEMFMKYSLIKLLHTNIPLENLITEDDDLALLDGLIKAVEEEKSKSHPCVESFEKIKTFYIHRKWKPIDRENYLSPQTRYYGAKYMPQSLTQLEHPMTFSEVAEELQYPLRFYHGHADFMRSMPRKPPNSGKVHIFLDEAGYGKTTYMTWLASYLVTNRQDCWIIRLNAIEYSQDFKKIMEDDGTTLDDNVTVRNLFQLIHLALIICNTNTKSNEETNSERRKVKRWAECITLSKGKVMVNCKKDASIEQQIALRVFREKFNEKSIVMLLDGFDEIAPDYKDVVLKLFSLYAAFDGVDKMYLTSRPYNFLDELVAVFQLSSIYYLEPFTRWDQYELLCSYLRYNLSGYDSCEDSQRKYLLEVFLEIIEINVHALHSIPLFFRMALDILMPVLEAHTDLKKYTISPCLFKELQTVFSKLRLLETFVNQKLSIVTSEKCGSNNTATHNVQWKRMASLMIDSTKSNLSLLGIYTIFGSQSHLISQEEQINCKKYMEEIEESREKSGIVEAVQGNAPVFIHRIFAEYFAACWLFNNRHRSEVKLFFKLKSYWEYKNSVVRNLFDEIAIQDEKGIYSPAHLAVIYDERDAFMRAIENKDNLHLITDRVGRTLLHMAVQYNFSTEIAKGLVEKMGNSYEQLINARDDLLHWSALDYAVFFKHIQMIEYLQSKTTLE